MRSRYNFLSNILLNFSKIGIGLKSNIQDFSKIFIKKRRKPKGLKQSRYKIQFFIMKISLKSFGESLSRNQMRLINGGDAPGEDPYANNGCTKCTSNSGCANYTCTTNRYGCNPAYRHCL